MDHPKIFISHSSNEQEVALAIQKLIESVFLHTDVYVSSSPISNPAGSAWYDKMLANLREAVALIIVCSERSIDRPWINFETGAGIARNVPVIPLMHSGLDASSVRIPFSLLQAKQASDKQHLIDLITALADVLGVRVPASIDALSEDAISRIESFERDYYQTPEVIQTYESSRDAQMEIGSRLKLCQERVVLCGAHFAVSLSDWRGDYIAAIERGVDIDIIMLDPDCDAVKTTAESYGMREDELRRECRDSLEKAKIIRDESISNGRGKVRVYLMNTLPRARYYVFDPERQYGVLTFTAYIEDIRSSYSPTIAYRADSPIAKKYFQVCQNLLNSASIAP